MSVLVQKAKLDSFDDDLVWVERHIAGDRHAFEHLYSKYYEKVFSIARGILLNADEASDTVQEIFTLVYRHIHRFDRRSRFSTWLFRVAVNRSIQEARKNKNKWRVMELNEALTKEEETVDPNSDPKIDKVLEEMSAQDRALLTLFYWEEMSLQEIAQSLGCTPNAAKTRLYRARERFRVAYEGGEA